MSSTSSMMKKMKPGRTAEAVYRDALSRALTKAVKDGGFDVLAVTAQVMNDTAGAISEEQSRLVDEIAGSLPDPAAIGDDEVCECPICALDDGDKALMREFGGTIAFGARAFHKQHPHIPTEAILQAIDQVADTFAEIIVANAGERH